MYRRFCDFLLIFQMGITYLQYPCLWVHFLHVVKFQDGKRLVCDFVVIRFRSHTPEHWETDMIMYINWEMSPHVFVTPTTKDIDLITTFSHQVKLCPTRL